MALRAPARVGHSGWDFRSNSGNDDGDVEYGGHSQSHPPAHDFTPTNISTAYRSPSLDPFACVKQGAQFLEHEAPSPSDSERRFIHTTRRWHPHPCPCVNSTISTRSITGRWAGWPKRSTARRAVGLRRCYRAVTPPKRNPNSNSNPRPCI